MNWRDRATKKRHVGLEARPTRREIDVNRIAEEMPEDELAR